MWLEFEDQTGEREVSASTELLIRLSTIRGAPRRNHDIPHHPSM
jgi:hypothetical protein